MLKKYLLTAAAAFLIGTTFAGSGEQVMAANQVSFETFVTSVKGGEFVLSPKVHDKFINALNSGNTDDAMEIYHEFFDGDSSDGIAYKVGSAAKESAAGHADKDDVPAAKEASSEDKQSEKKEEAKAEEAKAVESAQAQATEVKAEETKAEEGTQAQAAEVKASEAQASETKAEESAQAQTAQEQKDAAADAKAQESDEKAAEAAAQAEKDAQAQREAEVKAAQEEQARREAEVKAAQEEQARREAEAKAAQDGSAVDTHGLSQAEYDALCKIVYAEAHTQGEEGMLLIANVILNRVNSYQFPSSVTAVIAQPGQFTPVRNGRFATAIPNAAAVSAVNRALSGENHVGAALYFKSNRSEASWTNKTLVLSYGNHSFYY